MTTKAAILYAIRQKCLDCSCHQPSEVRDCRITACDLWPFRFGKDPEPSANRGFAKHNGYTGSLRSEADGGHQDSHLALSPAKTSVHTSDFGQGSTSSRKRLLS